MKDVEKIALLIGIGAGAIAIYDKLDSIMDRVKQNSMVIKLNTKAESFGEKLDTYKDRVKGYIDIRYRTNSEVVPVEKDNENEQLLYEEEPTDQVFSYDHQQQYIYNPYQM